MRAIYTAPTMNSARQKRIAKFTLRTIGDIKATTSVEYCEVLFGIFSTGKIFTNKVQTLGVIFQCCEYAL